jgi:hypothetical protein
MRDVAIDENFGRHWPRVVIRCHHETIGSGTEQGDSVS